MGKLLLTVIGLVVIVVAAGIVYFAVADVPPPFGKIEHAIPDSRLPK
jgi:hypothetical protein